LINLITNAIKFTQTEKERKILAKLSISETVPETDLQTYLPATTVFEDIFDKAEWGTGEIVYLIITVEDTGVGMSDEELHNLFARFSQASVKTHVRYGGSGLGLFISKSLVEMQGGQIGVTSTPGVGSSFSFFIKTRKTYAPIVEEVKYSNAAADANETGKKLAILVVEDNLVNQKILAKQLVKLGFDVHVANHGQEVLDWIAKTKYWKPNNGQGADLDVVLMDVEMPVMDGLTAMRNIRTLERRGIVTEHIPVIAVSANARTEQVQQALNAGMDDAIAKPFRIPELLPKIARLTRS